MKTPVRTGLVLSMSTLSANGIERMDCHHHPLLGVYPIEHVCDIIQRRFSARPAQPQTWDDLAQALIYEWARISRPGNRKLIRSVNFMCRLVIDCRVVMRNIYLTWIPTSDIAVYKISCPTYLMQTFKLR